MGPWSMAPWSADIVSVGVGWWPACGSTGSGDDGVAAGAGFASGRCEAWSVSCAPEGANPAASHSAEARPMARGWRLDPVMDPLPHPDLRGTVSMQVGKVWDWKGAEEGKSVE